MIIIAINLALPMRFWCRYDLAQHRMPPHVFTRPLKAFQETHTYIYIYIYMYIYIYIYVYIYTYIYIYVYICIYTHVYIWIRQVQAPDYIRRRLPWANASPAWLLAPRTDDKHAMPVIQLINPRSRNPQSRIPGRYYFCDLPLSGGKLNP